MPLRSGRGKYTAKRASAARTIQAAARKRAFTKARGGLKKVARIQRQPYAPQRVKNTASIATLSRAVNRLQKQQLGQYQKLCQQTGFYPSGVGSGFSRTRPICFMAGRAKLPTCLTRAPVSGSGQYEREHACKEMKEISRGRRGRSRS